MPQRAIIITTPRFVVALVALTMSACTTDVRVDEGDAAAAPAGIYAATCDSAATIDFQPGGVAEVNRNYCEGYAEELWDYAVADDTLTMALPGRLGDAGSVQDVFQISGLRELTLTSESSFITCGNCQAGDTWVH